jgi:hypothetical protein
MERVTRCGRSSFALRPFALRLRRFAPTLRMTKASACAQDDKRLCERLEAGDFFSDDEGVHFARALVG